MAMNTGGSVVPMPWMGDRGLTLRDFFAAMAATNAIIGTVPAREVAVAAYEMADAMLAVRYEAEDDDDLLTSRQ